MAIFSKNKFVALFFFLVFLCKKKFRVLFRIENKKIRPERIKQKFIQLSSHMLSPFFIFPFEYFMITVLCAADAITKNILTLLKCMQ